MKKIIQYCMLLFLFVTFANSIHGNNIPKKLLVITVKEPSDKYQYKIQNLKIELTVMVNDKVDYSTILIPLSKKSPLLLQKWFPKNAIVYMYASGAIHAPQERTQNEWRATRFSLQDNIQAMLTVCEDENEKHLNIITQNLRLP